MTMIQTRKAPQAVGAYSQGILIENTLYVSGQLPLIPETMAMVVDDIKAQTTRCLENILAIVEAAGLSKHDIVRCGVFMTNLQEFAAMNDAYSTFFGEHKPARAAVEVRALPKQATIEIDAIAIKT
ncbi:MAG: reactive intermediate/imine deaminase [Acholeplasmataceae bacterium]|nr:MAG: reactive intermediate/imine deaminase [Acholeplasmataceae bacterium]